MKLKALLFGVGTACAACCAALFLPALLTAAGLAAAIAISPKWIELGIVMLAVSGLAVFLLWRKLRAVRCAGNSACDCSESCSLPETGTKS